MPILKNYLQEELQNSLDLKRAYENQIKALPTGSLVPKKIKGHLYYYLVFRNEGRVVYAYKGKLSKDAVIMHRNAKEKRARIRSLLLQTNQQIQFLQKVLHDRKLQSMP